MSTVPIKYGVRRNALPRSLRLLAALALTASPLLGAHAQTIAAVAIDPAKLPKLGTVDARYQGYNIEMVEVTGGRFWAPYKQQGQPQETTPADDASKASIPAGMDPSLYRYRAPIDLSNPRLRKLAAALGPAYVRVSGTWANSTYFHDSDSPAPKTPPTGFGGVLTRSQWKGVLDFTKAVNGSLVTSFAVSPGVRDANGVWTPVEASKIFAYTKAAGGSIAAAEMFNEPTFASLGGVPKGYTAQTYGQDFKAFHAYVAKAAPKMIVLGPGSIGEAGSLVPEAMKLSMLKSTDMLDASGPGLDVFSYHFYGGGSQRCLRAGMKPMVSPETALTDEWLSKTNHDEEFYAALRDQYAPGKPLWLTETGETACGGDPWASTFLDSFRYLNQLGSLAKRSVQAIQHNTLAASDYALLDEDTFTPRPNYWAALLWRKLMGTTVLDADPKAAHSGTPSTPGLYLYAHCLRDQPGGRASSGGVTLLAINASRTESRELTLPLGAQRYTLSADNLTGPQVALNGTPLALTGDNDLPPLTPAPVVAGPARLEPLTITFLALPRANNPACKR